MSPLSEIDLDLVDWKILKIVENDSSITDTAIAGKARLDRGPVLGRLKTLETHGYLRLQWITNAGLRICGAYLTTKGIELLYKRDRDSEKTRLERSRLD